MNSKDREILLSVIYFAAFVGLILISIKIGLHAFEWLIDTFSQKNLIIFFASLIPGVLLIKFIKEGKLNLLYSEKKLLLDLVSFVLLFYFFFEYVMIIQDYNFFKYFPTGILALGAMLLAHSDLEKMKLERKILGEKSGFEKNEKSD